MKNYYSVFGFAGMLLMMAFPLVISGCTATGRSVNLNGTAAGDKPRSVLTQKLLAGVYEGSADGHSGRVHVRVRIEGGNIAEITIIDSREDPFTGGAAMDELLELALIYNTSDLDVIAGATESSEGFLTALRSALKQASTAR